MAIRKNVSASYISSNWNLFQRGQLRNFEKNLTYIQKGYTTVWVHILLVVLSNKCLDTLLTESRILKIYYIQYSLDQRIHSLHQK